MKYASIPKKCQSCVFVADIIPKDKFRNTWHCECLVLKEFRLKCNKYKNVNNNGNEEMCKMRSI